MLPLPSGREASSGFGAARYERHRPERTLRNTTPRSRSIWRIRAANCRGMSNRSSRTTSSAGGLSTASAPTGAELSRLAHTIARRVGRFLEREGLLARDAENSYLAGEAEDEGPMDQLLGSSITYRIAVGPQQGRKVFSLQSLPASDPQETLTDTVGKVAGFSLHAGVAAGADERKKLERLCRYISRPAVAEKRLSLTSYLSWR